MRPAERRQRVDEALEKVEMAHRAKHLPSQLSGGQQQRVAVARAVAGQPSILLADEPTGNLDSKNGEAVMQLLAGLHAEGSTICMVTHDPRYAQHAGREVHLFDGQMVDGPPARPKAEVGWATTCPVGARPAPSSSNSTRPRGVGWTGVGGGLSKVVVCRRNGLAVARGGRTRRGTDDSGQNDWGGPRGSRQLTTVT